MMLKTPSIAILVNEP